MGVWLVRVLDDAEPPAVSESSFADVESDEWWLAHVERLAELEVTKGCRTEPLRFCPDRSVTRAQMATFLVRAFDLAAAEPVGFTDTAGNTHETNIDALAAAGVTAGCRTEPLRYCPDRSVTRSQMATFLARALGLLEIQPPAERTEEMPAKEDDSQDHPTLGSDVFTAIAAGGRHYCALGADGAVECWGLNRSGQASPPDETFTALAAGGDHTCGLRTDGTIECWGNNRYGQTDAADGTFYTVVAGLNHSCGLRTNATAACWGWNDLGQTDSPRNALFVAVTAGGGHTCGLQVDGTIRCWGIDHRGQGSPASRSFAAMSAGVRHMCGLRTNGTIRCWGEDNHDQSSPPDGSFTAVAAGAHFSCGLRTDGTVACWGNDKDGQRTPPTGTFTAVTAGGTEPDNGSAFACGLRTDGTIECWGRIPA